MDLVSVLYHYFAFFDIIFFYCNNASTTTKRVQVYPHAGLSACITFKNGDKFYDVMIKEMVISFWKYTYIVSRRVLDEKFIIHMSLRSI